MTPNPVALALAKETGRSYHEVRIGINLLVNGGWTPFAAVDRVASLAKTDANIEESVRALVAEGIVGSHSHRAGK